MLVSNANQYTWKHFSTSPPPYTPAVQSAQKLLILITD